jgi:hypothetical protein
MAGVASGRCKQYKAHTECAIPEKIHPGRGVDERPGHGAGHRDRSRSTLPRNAWSFSMFLLLINSCSDKMMALVFDLVPARRMACLTKIKMVYA